MTLNKALKTDESSEIDEIEMKQLNFFKRLYDKAQSKNNTLLKDKERIKQLLSSFPSISEKAPGTRNTPIRLKDSREDNSLSDESVNDDAYFVKNSEGYKIEIITDEMMAINKNSKILKVDTQESPNNCLLLLDSDTTSNFNEKSKIKKCSSSNTKKIDSLVEEAELLQSKNKEKKKNRLENLKGSIQDYKRVLKLQKIVRKWLLKRQASDFSHAEDILKNELKKKIIHKC